MSYPCKLDRVLLVDLSAAGRQEDGPRRRGARQRRRRPRHRAHRPARHGAVGGAAGGRRRNQMERSVVDDTGATDNMPQFFPRNIIEKPPFCRAAEQVCAGRPVGRA